MDVFLELMIEIQHDIAFQLIHLRELNVLLAHVSFYAVVNFFFFTFFYVRLDEIIGVLTFKVFPIC